MEDDAPAPTLSLAELEEQFAELKAAEHEKEEAIAMVERMSTAEPGTEEYDDVFSEWGTDEQTRAVIQQLVRACPLPLSLCEVVHHRLCSRRLSGGMRTLMSLTRK